MLRLANVRRSLRSLGAPFAAHFVRYSGRLTLPLIAFATCAHSLRSFALVTKPPFGRAHSLVRTAVANDCSVIGYCELQVVFALRLIQLSLASRVFPYVLRFSHDILNNHEFVQSSHSFPYNFPKYSFHQFDPKYCFPSNCIQSIVFNKLSRRVRVVMY